MEPEEVQPPQEAEEQPLTNSDAGEPAEGASGESAVATVEETAVETQIAGEPQAATAEEPGPDAAEVEEEPEEEPAPPMEFSDTELKAILEAVIYVTEEPLEAKQIAAALQQKQDRIDKALAELVEEFARPERGLQIREIAGGFKMATKPEHHEAVRQFVKNLKPSFKMTPAALETLAVIAYKQPITAPEIMEIRGVQGAGVLKTLVDRKLITTAGRKNVIGKPILYKTTKDFLVQFGLKSVNELPTLKEFEELRRLAFSEDEVPEGPASAAEAAVIEPMQAPDKTEAVESPAEAPAAEEQAATAPEPAPASEENEPETDKVPDTASEA